MTVFPRYLLNQFSLSLPYTGHRRPSVHKPPADLRPPRAEGHLHRGGDWRSVDYSRQHDLLQGPLDAVCRHDRARLCPQGRATRRDRRHRRQGTSFKPMLDGVFLFRESATRYKFRLKLHRVTRSVLWNFFKKFPETVSRKVASFSCNGAESLMQRRHVFQLPCYTMQSHREISSDRFHENVSPCNIGFTLRQ